MATTTIPVPPASGVPSPKDIVSREFLSYFQNRVFVLWYRNKFRPASANVLANSLEEARERGQKYCERFSLRFISVHPFFLDLDKLPVNED